MIDVVAMRGPLDERHLTWITELYGPVDEKYASLDYVRHQFADNPFGWSVHTFVVDDDKPGGHCAAIPFRARLGPDELVAGKIEAVVLAEAYRGRRTADDRSLAVAMLSTMYEVAHDHGIPLLFGLAPPAVAAVHARAGCKRLPLPDPTWVHVATPDRMAEEARARRTAVRGVVLAQRLLLAAAARTSLRVDAATDADVELAAAAPVSDGTWTISGSEAWDWYVGSGLLHAVEAGGARALVRLANVAGADVQVVAWRPGPHPLASAHRLLGALARIARERDARTLRFQPWAGPAGDGALTRACRLAAFVRRTETELVLHGRPAELADAAVQLTPFFYVTF